MSNLYPPTRASLLDRLVLAEGSKVWNRDWQTFVEIYSPALRKSIAVAFHKIGWSRLNDDIFNQVLSDVVTKFLRASANFKYDPARGKFRGYLTNIVQWCVKDYVTAHNCNSSESLSNEHETDDPTVSAPSESADRAWRMAAFRDLLDETRGRLGPQTTQIFEMTKILEMPVKDVMSELNVSRTTVDNANSRVMQILRELIENSPLKEEMI
jgi:RNA polymerase sigma factor (sigma-70 family)